MKIFETMFDVGYLLLVIFLGIQMLRWAKEKQFVLFGVMTLCLGIGDSFHLVPRVFAYFGEGGFERYQAMLGVGQMITSITMTVFYLLFYFVWRERYHIQNKNGLTWMMIGLFFSRIILSVLPQNNWMNGGDVLFGIYRNIPFAIMGIVIVWLFYQSAKENKDTSYRWMWLYVTLSFGFYLPVVLFAHSFPPIGALMMPKTVSYVLVVITGTKEVLQEKKEKNM